MKWLVTTNETLINTRYIGQLRVATANENKFFILAEFYYPNSTDRENFYLGEFTTKKEALAQLSNLLKELNNDNEHTN